MTATPNDRSTVVGLAAAVGAYGSWGVLPLYFRALSELSAPTVLAHRVVASIVFLSFVLVIRRELPAVRAAGAHLRPLVASAVLLAINWLVFVWAVNSGRALDTSLGYYVNPLLNVLLGVFFLGESLGAAQVAAVGLAVLGVAVQVWGRGGVPWVSLVLAGTFAVYGLLRKRTPVGGAPALFVETVAMAPAAAAWLAVAAARGEPVLAGDAVTNGLVVGLGVVTAVPLVLFGVAAHRLPLATMGIVQYLAPTGQLLTAVLVFHETFTIAHAVSFALIWAGLGLYTVDALTGARRAPKLAV